MLSEIMLELSEELVDPEEAYLDDQLEETLDNEEDVMLGIGEDDDDVIEYIDKGNRMEHSDPIDFTDDDVDDSLDDDMNDDDDVEDLDDDDFDIDEIEEANTFIY